MVTLPSISKEYIFTSVTAESDPAAATVDFTITAVGTEPTSGWVAGSWTGATVNNGNGTYTARARVLVGAGTSFELADGNYWVWVRINATPESPIRKVGELTIT